MSTKYDIFYKTSQGELRNSEILERYKTIMDYFIKHPNRIIANWLELSSIYHNDNDAVLRTDQSLRNELLQRVLNSKLKNPILEN